MLPCNLFPLAAFYALNTVKLRPVVDGAFLVFETVFFFHVAPVVFAEEKNPPALERLHLFLVDLRMLNYRLFSEASVFNPLDHLFLFLLLMTSTGSGKFIIWYLTNSRHPAHGGVSLSLWRLPHLRQGDFNSGILTPVTLVVFKVVYRVPVFGLLGFVSVFRKKRFNHIGVFFCFNSIHNYVLINHFNFVFTSSQGSPNSSGYMNFSRLMPVNCSSFFACLGCIVFMRFAHLYGVICDLSPRAFFILYKSSAFMNLILNQQ